MRPTLACCALVCSLSSLPAYGDSCPAQTADEASALVQAAFAAWNEAVVEKDLEKTMAIFSQSLRFQVQGSPDFGYPRLFANYADKRSVAVDSQDRRSPAEVKHDKLQPGRAGAIARVNR